MNFGLLGKNIFIYLLCVSLFDLLLVYKNEPCDFLYGLVFDWEKTELRLHILEGNVMCSMKKLVQLLSLNIIFRSI